MRTSGARLRDYSWISGTDAGGARGEASADGGDEIVWGDGLAQNTRHVDVIERQRGAGHNDNGDVARLSLCRDLLLYGQAVQSWQHQVEDDDICFALFEDVKCRQPIVRFDDLETGKGQRGAIHASKGEVVLDDQHRFVAAHSVMITEESINAAPNRKLCRVGCGRANAQLIRSAIIVASSNGSAEPRNAFTRSSTVWRIVSMPSVRTRSSIASSRSAPNISCCSFSVSTNPSV